MTGRRVTYGERQEALDHLLGCALAMVVGAVAWAVFLAVTVGVVVLIVR